MQNLGFPGAPRVVPVSLQVLNFFNRFAQIGWALFGFGMLFFWVFTLNTDLSFITFRGPHETVDGTVLRVEDTQASENDVHVQANHYQYSVAGSVLTGTSYSTGVEVAAGETVPVEYDEDDPSRSRIEGMRRAMFGPGLLAINILPLIGLLMLIPATRTGLKRNRLLREGLVAQGKLIGKSATNTRINHRRVYELRFEFTTRDGRRATAKTRTTETDRLQDEALEPLLYDPADPTRAYLLDEAPARPQFDFNGTMIGRPTAALATLILPAIVIGGHALILFFRLT